MIPKAIPRLGRRTVFVALALLALVLPTAAAFPSLDERAAALERSGTERLRAGDYPAAVAHLRQAVALRERLGDRAREAATRNELCLAQQRGGRFDAARACYETTLALVRSLAARSAGDESDELKALEATLLNNLGGIASNQGRPDDHRRYLLQALALHRERGDLRGEAVTRNNLGAYHRRSGELEEALDHYERALTLFEETEDRYWQARTRNNLGYAYLSVGETERARDWFLGALPLRRAVGDTAGEAVTLLNLGRAWAADDRSGQAFAFTRRALDAALKAKNPRTVAAARRLLGEIHLHRGQPGAAREPLEAALAGARAMGQPEAEAEALELLARVELALGVGGDLATAAAHAGRAADLFRASDDPVGQVRARVTLARAERRRGRNVQAREQVDAALALLQPIWDDLADPLLRASFLATQRAAFETSVTLWMDRHRTDPSAGHHRTALAAAEAARARSLLALTGSGRDAPAPLDTNAVQALLDDDTTLIEIFLADEAGYAWVVTGSDVRAHELPPRAEIDPLAEEAHQRLAAVHRRTADDHRLLAELGRLLAGPLHGHPPGRRLVVVADGTLHFVPFAALPAADGEPLLAQHEIVHVPSASVLAATRRRAPRASATTVAVLADPVVARDDRRLAGTASPPGDPERAVPPATMETLRRLPWSRREAQAVAALVPPERRRVALGVDARRSRVVDGELTRDARILHFATHGLVDPRRPERSGLVLSRFDAAGRPLEGFLGFDDVAGLDLSADLVVLSGCRTALGRPLAGAGLVGLTHAFRQAGASRVVASLWPVRDAAAAELMERFYRAHLAGGLPAAAALRAAQLDLRREPRFRDPYHWAAFTVQGDWR